MVTDFLNWMSKYANGSWKDVIDCFGYHGLHQVFHVINFSFYKLVGLDLVCWYLLFAVLHGINAYLLYHLIKKITLRYNIRASYLALLSGLLFLCFPYNVEVVTWKACLHYLLITLLLLSILIITYRYIDRSKISQLLLIHFMYFLCLFILELSFIIPFVVFLFVLFDRAYYDRPYKSLLVKIPLVQLSLLTLYLIISRLVIGDYIGHYGAEEHIKFDTALLFGNAWKYFFKNLFLCHFWNFGYKEWLYNFVLSQTWIYSTLSLIAVILSGLVIIRRKYFSANLKVSLLFTFSFFVCLLPIITLYFMYIHHYENDRYGYMANAFFIPALLIFISSIKSKQLKRLLYLVYIIATIYGFCKMMSITHSAGKLQHSLLKDFNPPRSDRDLYFLANPENLKGAYLYNDSHYNADKFIKSLDLLYEKKVTNTCYDIAQYNANDHADVIKVDILDSNTLKVYFGQYGNWFWKSKRGLKDYDTDRFFVDKENLSYTLTLKPVVQNCIFVYPVAGKWKYIVRENGSFIKS